MSDSAASAKAMEKVKPNESKTRSSEIKKQEKAANPSFNMGEIRELAELVNEHGFTDFEFENENIRVRLSKMTSPSLALPAQSYATPPALSAPAAVESPEVKPEPEEDLHTITSPIVGTFYRAPGPGKEPYVKEGSKVGPDSVVCIVEAMKLMNEIQAEAAGEVVRIYVEDGKPVEYGQPLFGIRK